MFHNICVSFVEKIQKSRNETFRLLHNYTNMKIHFGLSPRLSEEKTLVGFNNNPFMSFLVVS
jgi:hypothetical protein